MWAKSSRDDDEEMPTITWRDVARAVAISGLVAFVETFASGVAERLTERRRDKDPE